MKMCFSFFSVQKKNIGISFPLEEKLFLLATIRTTQIFVLVLKGISHILTQLYQQCEFLFLRFNINFSVSF